MGALVHPSPTFQKTKLWESLRGFSGVWGNFFVLFIVNPLYKIAAPPLTPPPQRLADAHDGNFTFQ